MNKRLEALWELIFRDPDNKHPTTLWGLLRFFWHEFYGPVIGGVIALAVMLAVLLLTYTNVVRP